MSDPVISIGTNCEISYNIRHTFQFERAYPFDWWITPVQSVADILRDRFRLEIDDKNLVHVTAPESVLNRKYGILHHHDFPRDGQDRILDGWAAHIPALAEKYHILGERFFADIERAERALLIVNGDGSHRAYAAARPVDETVYLEISDTLRDLFPRTRVSLAIFNSDSAPTDAAKKAARADSSIVIGPSVKDYGDRADKYRFAKSLRGWQEALLTTQGVVSALAF